MLVKTLAITTLAALAAAAPSPAEEENSLEARNNWGWIPALYARAQTWPNCGIAGVNCGKSGKYWFCAPHRASCCKIYTILNERDGEGGEGGEGGDGGDNGGDDKPADTSAEDTSFIWPPRPYRKTYCPYGYRCAPGGRFCIPNWHHAA